MTVIAPALLHVISIYGINLHICVFLLYQFKPELWEYWRRINKEKYYTQEWVDESQLSHLNFFSVGWRMWTFPALYEVPHDFLSFFTSVKRSQKMDLSHLWGRGTWRPDSHSMPQFLPEKQYQRNRRHSGATERHSEVEGWGKWHLQVQMLLKSPCIKKKQLITCICFIKACITLLGYTWETSILCSYSQKKKKETLSVNVSALTPQQTCLKLGAFVGLISTTLSWDQYSSSGHSW